MLCMGLFRGSKTGRVDSGEGRFNDPGVLLKIGYTVSTKDARFRDS